jgi:hypothetical protein
MGMTDRQFDAYQQSILQTLERINEEVLKLTNGVESKELGRLIRDIGGQLKKP